MSADTSGVRRLGTRLGALGIAGAVAAGLATAGFVTTSREVTINVDGASRVVSVSSASVDEALREADVPFTTRDAVQPNRSQSLREGMTITVVHARPAWVMMKGAGTAHRLEVPGTSLNEQLLRVRQERPQASLSVPRTPDSATTLPLVAEPTKVKVHIDGDERTIDAPAGLSTQGVLAKADISLSPLDQVSVALDGTGLPSLTVTRISREGVTEDVEIPFETKEVSDDSLFEGQKIVETEGVTGLKTVTYAVQSSNGKEFGREVVKEEVKRPAVTQVVRVGTRPLPSGMDLPQGSGVPAGDAQQMALAILPEFGFGADQFTCLQTLWTRESGWSSTATNPSSGAYGIPQALPASKMASAGADWRTNPATQIRWGLGYIKGRYATPCGALAAWNSKGWY